MKKIAFATCVQLGLSCVEEIYKIGGNLDLLITLNDDIAQNKSGRIYLDKFSDKTEILKIKNINDKEVIDKLREKEIDWLFIIGWSQIAKEELLNTPQNGCIGMHPTLLPQGRGRAAIPWAIIKGLDKTGVTLFKLDQGVDTGEIIAQETVLLNESTTATDLYEKIDELHVKLISNHWENIINDKIILEIQDESLATIWEGRKPEDGLIKSEFSVRETDALVRAVTKPYPGAFYFKDGKKYVVWSADFSKENGDFKLNDGYLILKDFEVFDE